MASKTITQNRKRYGCEVDPNLADWLSHRCGNVKAPNVNALWRRIWCSYSGTSHRDPEILTFMMEAGELGFDAIYVGRGNYILDAKP